MIMAAGLGTRLYPLTGALPKPMVPILNRPALEHIVRLLAEHGVTEAVVNLHHFPDIITRYFGDGSPWGVSLHYAFEEVLLGTAGGVKNNQAFLGGGSFLVMSGDALTDVHLGEMFEAHRRRGSIATLAVTEVADPSEYGVVVTDEQQRVVGFQEKPSAEEALSHLCNCGIYVFEPGIFERIPAGTFYDFGRQVLPELVADGVPFHVHRVCGYWSDVGSLGEYSRGNADALRGAVRVAVPGMAQADGLAGRGCSRGRRRRAGPPGGDRRRLRDRPWVEVGRPGGAGRRVHGGVRCRSRAVRLVGRRDPGRRLSAHRHGGRI